MLAWVERSIFQKMSVLATHYHPYETGGCLLGYWVKPLAEIVICETIGPGPNAYHSKNRFVPDNEWQTSKIADVYGDSGNVISYLGDWHSHPGYASANLSWRDKRTLRRIATYPPARVPNPIMAIIAKGEPWFWKIWCCSLRDYGFLAFGKISAFDQLCFYGDKHKSA